MTLKPGTLTLSDFQPCNLVHYVAALIAPYAVLVISTSTMRPGNIFWVYSVCYTPTPLAEQVPIHRGRLDADYLLSFKLKITDKLRRKMRAHYPSWEEVNNIAERIRGLKLVKNLSRGRPVLCT